MKKHVLVLGLNTFGMSIVKQLSKYNCEVMAIDKEIQKVEEADEYVTHALRIDIKNADEISGLSLDIFDVAIITIDDLEASVMAACIFKEKGIPEVIVKAKSDIHKRILEKIGVDKVISLEEAMGIKIAKSIMNANVIDAINFHDDYSIVEINAIDKWIGKDLSKLSLRTEYGMNVLCIKNKNKELEISPSQNYVVEDGDVLVAIVENKKIEKKGLKID